MKKGWELEKLGDVCKTSAGGTPLKSHKEYYENGTIPWIRSGEVNNKNIIDSEIKITQEGLNNSSAKIFPPKTVVIAMYGATAGQVGILNFECSSNQAVCGVLPNKNFITEYIYYFFLNFKEKLIAQAVGNAQPNISQAKIKDSLIPVLPLTEQKQIVAKLDKAFAAIDKAEANTKQNIANAKELFQSRLDEIFTNGANSKGWVTEKLGDVCEVIAGQSPKSEFYNKEGKGLPFYQGKKEFSNEFIGKPTTWTTKVTKKAIANDILMSVRAPVGPVNISTQEICIGRGLAAIRNGSKINNRFLFYYLVDNEKKIEGSTGSVFDSISTAGIRKFNFPFPTDNKTQEKIVKELDKLREATDKLVANYEQKLSDMAELRKSLLEQAFLGNLT